MGLADRIFKYNIQQNEVAAELKELVQKISQFNFVNKIILFGSHATGQAHDFSDYDLMVIVQDEKSLREAYRSISKSVVNRTRPMDLLIFTQSYFLQKSQIGGVCFDAAIEGIELYPKWGFPE